MARRTTHMGERIIESDNGFGWSRQKASVASVSVGKYVTEVFGVAYELEKRRTAPGEEPYTGWYLYSKGATDNPDFYGQWCGRALLPSVDAASKMIAKHDLRGKGHTPRECADELTRLGQEMGLQ